MLFPGILETGSCVPCVMLFLLLFFFSSPPHIPFSVHLAFITIPTPCFSMPVPFFNHTFTQPIYSLICIPNRLFFRPYFPLVYLSAWLQFSPPPLQSCLSPPAHTRFVYPHTLPPHFPWKSVCFFPPLKPFPDSFSKKVPAAQIILF